MKNNLIYLYIIILFISTIKCKEQIYNHTNKENNLFFVFSSFRHGARKPFVKYDVFHNKIEHPGKITQFGKKQHLIIGDKNRERYFNFLNLGNKTFDTEQILVRSSHIQRTIISTRKQLQGLLKSKSYNKIIQVIKLESNLFVLYNLNITNNTNIYTYYKTSCNSLRKLNQNDKTKKIYHEQFYTNILPLYEKCYGEIEFKSVFSFCDQVFSSYYEYKYEAKRTNNIGKCGEKTMNTLNNYCIKYYNSIRGWNEKNGYYFYTFFNLLFKYMDDVINGTGKLKMIMIGGHDSSVDILMNYFNGMHIINRTEYPHYAFNILMELRKYNNIFYIEIYYNDILKYNQTLDKFKHILAKSKYSNINNYCRNFYEDKEEKNKNRNIIDKSINKLRINLIYKIIIILCFTFIVIQSISFISKKRKKIELNNSKEENIDNISKQELNITINKTESK